MKVNNRPLEVMVDSGAAFTCIRPEDAIHLPMSGQLIRMIGFEGVKQLIPLTEPIELSYKNLKITIPILYQNIHLLHFWEEMLCADWSVQ